MSEYGDFAADYEWLFDDEQLTGRPFVAGYEHVLAALGPGASILDCACGIGVEALELARRGFAVSASDASEAMTAEAARRSDVADPPLRRIETCTWADLPLRFTERFDLVVCNGNSLVHASGRGRLVAALAGMRAVLAPGGRLIIGTRNFEHLRRNRPDFDVPDHAVRRRDVACIPIYRWHIPDGWEEPHVAHLHLVFLTGDAVVHRRHDVSFVPYRSDDLMAALAAADLTVVSTDRTEDRARYTIVAQGGPSDGAHHQR